MSDLDDLKALLDRWDVPYTEDVAALRNSVGEFPDHEGRTVTVTERLDGSPKVTGYNGFLTRFEFTLDGTFARMGAWE